MSSSHATISPINDSGETKGTNSDVSPRLLPRITADCHKSTDVETDDSSAETVETNTVSDHVSTETDDAYTAGTDDASSRCDDVRYDDSVYAAPEGGWGWMVVAAGFGVAFLVDGMLSSFGLLIPDLLTSFDAGMALTSSPPAILQATYQLSGPVTGHLVKRWGCRLVGFCGGLLAALGVGISAYAANIYIFILGFGLITGVGVGLIYLPSVTMVNVYFHKKRGMVAGIITSGSGFGLLALAPLTEMLMEQYGWRGCYLIMAAIALHFCVCASLMRPLLRPPPSSPHSSQTLDGVEVRVQGEDSWSLVSAQELEVSGEGDHLVPTTHLSRGDQDINSSNEIYLVENGLVLRFPKKRLLGENPALSHLADTTCHGSLLSSVRNVFLSPHGSHVLSGAGTAGPTDSALLRSRSQGHLECRPSHRPHPPLPGNVLSTWLACQVPPSLTQHALPSHQSSDNMVDHTREPNVQKSVEQLTTSGRQCQEKDAEWGQSCPSLRHEDDALKHALLTEQPEMNRVPLLSRKGPAEVGHREPSVSDSFTPPTASSSEEPTSWEAVRRRGVGGWVRERRLFTSFLIGAFLIQLACSVPPLLAPSFAYQHGVSKEHVATILAVYGLLNTAGRLLAGVLVYWGVRTLHVHNVSTLLSAVACFTLPLSTSFPSIAVSLGLHGFFLGAFPPLQPVILVEYLGLDRLTSTFGTMCLVKAFASAAGAPLAGMLLTVTGTYTVPLAVCGAVLVMAAILHQLMDCWP